MKIQLVLLCLIFLACTTTQKTVLPTSQSRALDDLVAKKAFIIESDRAFPMVTTSMAAISNSGLLGNGNSAGNINLIGNYNYFKIEGDTISADLPYYGERRMGGGYTMDSGIKFKGIPEKYSLTKDDATQQYDVQFQVRGMGTETFMVALKLYPNWNSSITIYSSQRNAIRYQGVVSALQQKL